jgi:membrane associated rhomboid family serine protease
LLLVVANAGLLWQTPHTGWVLLPSAVRQGEWWRLFLHPWVHVGWYHLMLDAAAFVCLFFTLDRSRSRDRWMILASVWAGQGLAVWLGEPRIEALGLCGLSGIGQCVQPGARYSGAWHVRSVQKSCLALTLGIYAAPFCS